MCLEENVALPASQSEQNEASTESTKTKRNETTNATAIIPTTLPEDRSFELKQPKQTSGNSRRCCTTLQNSPCWLHVLHAVQNFHSMTRVNVICEKYYDTDVFFHGFLYFPFLGILNLVCEGIRIRRYMSNGFCTSRRPFRDMICDGKCLAMDELHHFPKFSKIISNHKRAWRCVADETRTRKVTMVCMDGTKRKRQIRVTRSCKCKRYTHKQNQTNPWVLKRAHHNREKTLIDIVTKMKNNHSFTLQPTIVTYTVCTKFNWVCILNLIIRLRCGKRLN